MISRDAGGRLAMLLIAVLLVPPAVAAGEDLAEIKARGVLRVLGVVHDPEDEFLTDQPGRGLDRELLEGFARLQGVTVEVVKAGSWDALVPALLRGKGDLIAGRFTVTEARKKLIDFTPEVFPTRNVVVTRAPHRVIRTLEELRAEKVGTVKGTSLADAVAAAGVPAAQVDDGVPSGRLPDALRSGRVGAVVLGVESAIAARRTDPDLKLGLFLGSPGAMAWGVSRKSPQLLEVLSEYVASARRTATWNRLVVKYFGSEAPEVLHQARGDREP
jgi:ABC-type amino acid transport substrate-binding protein